MSVVSEHGIPRWPAGWYAVARSADLRARPLAVTIAGRDRVLYRGASGRLHALDAHCPHMGAHLRHARVDGEALRCPLHDWRISAAAQGRCRAAGHEIQEARGLVFVWQGAGAPGALPVPHDAERFAWTTAQPLDLPTDWRAMVVNGFDLTHLEAVHKRRLRAAPEIERLAHGPIRMRYVSEVTGEMPSDRAMRWLSGDRIEVTQICHGTTVEVRSRLKSRETAAVLSLLPTDAGVRAFAAFGITESPLPRAVRGPWTALRLRVTEWLFTAFLRRDFRVIEDMALRVDVPDVGVRSMARFLASLPDLEAELAAPALVELRRHG